MAGNIDNPHQNDDPEKHKQDLLKKQKGGKGHWKLELASNSEEAVRSTSSSLVSEHNLEDSNSGGYLLGRRRAGTKMKQVKADRHCQNESIEEMQKKTAKHAQEKSKEVTSGAYSIYSLCVGA